MRFRRERTKWKGTGLAMLAALLLSGCAQKPDLGRYSPNAFDRLVTSAISDGKSAELPLTGDERDLRALAATLAEEKPAADRDRLWGLSHLVADGEDEKTPASLRYYERLRAAHPTSPASLLNAFADDVQADAMTMDRFAATAAQVIAADQARADELLGHGAAATVQSYEGAQAFAAARDRITKNGWVIDRTTNTLASRLVAYRTALSHARVDAPEPGTIATIEAAIRAMEDRMVAIDAAALRHEGIVDSLGKRKGPEA